MPMYSRCSPHPSTQPLRTEADWLGNLPMAQRFDSIRLSVCRWQPSRCQSHPVPRFSLQSRWRYWRDERGPKRDRQTLVDIRPALDKNGEGKETPLADNWGLYCLSSSSFEIWQGRDSRLYDRKDAAGKTLPERRCRKDAAGKTLPIGSSSACLHSRAQESALREDRSVKFIMKSVAASSEESLPRKSGRLEVVRRRVPARRRLLRKRTRID